MFGNHIRTTMQWYSTLGREAITFQNAFGLNMLTLGNSLIAMENNCRVLDHSTYAPKDPEFKMKTMFFVENEGDTFNY